MPPKLGIIAGGGAIPVQLVDHCRDTGREFFVLALKGHVDQLDLETVPHREIRLGAAGRMISTLHMEAVEDVILIGRLRRPSLFELRPDARAAKIALKARRHTQGDDGLLSAIIRELEGEGFNVVGIDEVMSAMLAPKGIMGKHTPDKLALADIDRGIDVVKALGGLDVGQGAIIQDGIVLAVEASEGTDQLIRRSKELHRKGPGGILVKCMKPGQERRVDLPTIGVTTIALAAEAGLRGIAVEAGATLIVEQSAVIDAADNNGLFLSGFEMLS